MAYGLRYIREFTNRHDELCRLEFWFKDYTGSNQTVFGSRDSFVLSKELDDPFEPIQAQPAKVELLAESAVSFSVDDFYSEDDEFILCKFYLSPAGGTERTLFFSGNANIQFIRNGNNNNIYLPEITGVIPGQQLTINDINYTIVAVDNSIRGTTALQVVETVTDTTLIDADFAIYDIITEKLIYTGFVLQDETADAFIDYDHFIQFTLTDNLGLLQDVSFDTACGDTDPYQTFTIADYLSIILSATGLQLPIQIFANIYETTTEDRSDNAAATFADQTRIKSAAFADANGKWQSCYEILSVILKTFNCFICQRQGAWVIYRWGELRSLNNSTFNGTQFNNDLSDKQAISLPNKPVMISDSGLNVLVGGEGNVMYKTRPYKYVLDTFNYQQPAELLKDEDLKDLGALKSTSTSTDGLYRYEDYEFPAYFTHDNNGVGGANDASFIRVVTEIATGAEYEREIVTPFTTAAYKWLTFERLEVSKGDTLDFTCQVKALAASSNPLRVNFRFELFCIDGNGNTILYVLSPFNGSNTLYGQYTWIFEGNAGAQVYKTFIGIPYDFSDTITDWQQFSISGNLVDKWNMPPFPLDGVLLVSLNGANNTTDGNLVAHRDVATKEISLTVKNRINDSYNVTGQTHTITQDGTIKNKSEENITVDDSPRLSIAGTLVVDRLTHFNYINVDAYMNLTKLWQRSSGEQQRLGQIATAELKQVYSHLRYKLDCTFIWQDTIDNLTTFQLNIFPGVNFRMALISSINYADCTCKCVLMEMWESGESDVSAKYEFEYLYEKS